MTTLIIQQKWEKFSLVKSMLSVAATFQLWIDRHHQRKQLAQLALRGSRLLSDIGLDADQVAVEVNKPFWIK